MGSVNQLLTLSRILKLILAVCFLTGCGKSPQISPSISLEAANTEPISTNTPVPTLNKVPSPAPQSRITTPTVTQDERRELSINLRIAYSIYGAATDQTTEIWILEYPYIEPKLVFQFPENTSLASDISWSHDGNTLAFLLHTDLDKTTLYLLDVTNLMSDTIPIEDLNAKEQIIYTIQWSNDDQWVGFPTRDYSENLERSISYLVDLQSQQVFALDGIEFSDWLKSDPLSFLALERPTDSSQVEISLNNKVVVVEVPGMEEKIMIDDMGTYSPYIWFDIRPHPDGKSAVSVKHDSNIKTIFFWIDLYSKQWSEITTIDHSYTPFIFSPNGDWLIIESAGGKTYFWDTSKNDPTEGEPIKQQSRYTYQRFWTKDGTYLVYVDGHQIYRVKPTMPEEPELVIDLAFLGLADNPYQSYSVVEVDP